MLHLLALTSLCLGAALGGGTLALIVLEAPSAALTTHLAGVLPGGWGLWLWLRATGSRQRGLLPLTVGITACIPGFGLLALPVAAAYGAREPVREAADNTLVVEVPRLPFKPLAFDQTLSFSRGGLFEVLERSSDTDKQIVAVMATTRMKAKQAVPLLKVAMRDEEDDVRLLAYSIKDRKESEINGRIKRLLQVLEQPALSERERASTERSLAFLYWELIYLDLAEGDIREFFLNQVVERARSALDALSYGPLSVLLARACMEQGDYRGASDALDAAEAAGVERLGLAPYRAEIAFHEGRYDEVRRRLLEIGTSPHESLREVLGYWLRVA
ncbi:MAG: hypothetical protein AB7I04_06185 [Pseudomonadales bacterium]